MHLRPALHGSSAPFIAEKDGKAVVNAGSVGVPATGSVDAGFAVIELKNGVWTPRLVHVAYDVERAVGEFYESGLIDQANVWARAVIAALRTGRNYVLDCVRAVERLKTAKGAEQPDEYYWERAAEILGI